MGFFDAQGINTNTPQSQQNTTGTATSNVAPWAQPYVNNYLTKSQDLINQGGTTPFQNQVYSSAQNLGTPEQFAQGSNLANQGGQGNLSTAPMALNYGQMGTGIGAQGIGIGAQGQAYGMNAGQNYANMATSPQAMQAYMNPYVQQSLQPQLQLLNQQQALQNQQIQGQATGQGAFGGNRATLAQGLNAQNYDLAKQQAIAQGYNTAYTNAQQAQQFGSNLGLQGAQMGTNAGLAGLASGMQGVGLGLQGVQGAQQGYNGATQAGSALGNIGAQQGQYQLGALTLQNQIAQQQYNQPYQQLQFGQSMLNGLPINQQNTTGQQIGYQAAPNYASQIGGLGTAALGTLGLLNQAGALSGIKSMFGSNIGADNTQNIMNGGTGGGSAFTASNGSPSFDLPSGDPYNLTQGGQFNFGASGGLPKDFKTKSYAKGGLVKSGLNDIRLYQLLG